MIFVPRFSFIAVYIDMGFDQEFTAYQSLKIPANISIPVCNGKNRHWDAIPFGFPTGKIPVFSVPACAAKEFLKLRMKKAATKSPLPTIRDDIIETLLINLFYGREISTMMPNQSIFGGKLHIIRPLAYLSEGLLKKYAREREFPMVEKRLPDERSFTAELYQKIAGSARD